MSPQTTKWIWKKRKDRQILDVKKLWNMRVTVMSIGVGTLVTVPKGMEKRLEELEIRGRIETTQTTAVLKSARILKRDPDTSCHYLNFSERPTNRCWCENFAKREIILIYSDDETFEKFVCKTKRERILRSRRIFNFWIHGIGDQSAIVIQWMNEGCLFYFLLWWTCRRSRRQSHIR